MKEVSFLLTCIVLIIGAILLKNDMTEKTKTDGYNNVRIKYHYSQKNIDNPITKHDSEEIKKILNNSSLFSDNPSCGFSKDISFQFNGGQIIYSIAQDSDPILKDENTGKYFKISEKERDKVNKILEKYGAIFPAL